MFLGTRFQTNNISVNYEIDLDGCKLARVEEAKFLGITIDENLTSKNKVIMYVIGMQEILVF